MEEEPLEEPELYDGTVLEADADGDIVIPPAPVENDEAPPAHVDPVPNAKGGDPDDTSDDSGDDDGGNNADENPEKEEDEDPRYHGAVYHKHSTEDENGQFCILLREVLQHLGYTMKPLYVTKQFSEPGMRDYYTSRVYIRMPLNDADGWRYRSSHHSTTHSSSDHAAVNDAVRRALWSICNAKRARLFNSEYHHVPRRASGTEETIVPAGGDDRIDILARVTATLNTDLGGQQLRWIGTMKSCQLPKQKLHVWKHNWLDSDSHKKWCHIIQRPPLRARDSSTALLKLQLVLARILGYFPLPFTFPLDRSYEDVLLVINECWLQTCLSWIFV
jgi:hypothetical protein